MDLDDFRRLTAGTAIEDATEELHALLRPGLRATRGGAPATGQSKVGGEPDLPAGTDWPAIDDEPLAFFGQLDLAVLDPDVWPGPREGLLSVFVRSVEHAPIPWGVGGVRILHHAPGTALAAHSSPEVLQFEEQRIVSFTREWTLPDHAAGQEDPALYGVDIHTNGPRADAFQRLCGTLDCRGYSTDFAPVVAGWPMSLQSPVFGAFTMDAIEDIEDFDEAAMFAAEAAAAEDWFLLLQFATDDGGFVSVGLPTEDLRAGRWDRANWESQSD